MLSQSLFDPIAQEVDRRTQHSIVHRLIMQCVIQFEQPANERYGSDVKS